MKKFYFLLAVAALLLSLISCKKPATVQLTNNVSSIGMQSENDGTLYSITLMLYKGSEMVGQANLGDIAGNGGKSSIIELEDYVEKVKVMFKFLPSSSPLSNPYFYTSQFYLISSNKDNEIILTNETLVSDSPSKGSISIKILK